MADVTRGAASALGPAKRRKSKTVPDMHIKPAEDGAYIVRHTPGEDADPTSQRPQTYALTNKAALLAHVDQHTPDDPTEDGQPEAGAE